MRLGSISGFTEIAGRRMEHVILGAGAPRLVFLHEGIGSIELWRELPAEVCDRSGESGLVYSRLGHGRSDPLPAPHEGHYLHTEALEVLPGVRTAFGIGRPVLVGHSDGASIALIHAAAGHEVAALVLIAPHVFVEDEAMAPMREIADRFRNGDLRERMAKYHADPDGLFEAWSGIWTSPAFATWNIEEGLERITAPILLIQADDDDYGTMEQLDRIQARVQAPVTRLQLSTGGHSPHLARSREIAAMTAAFIVARREEEVEA